jgi:DNA-binding GntR family transcriptional regulator
MADRRFPKPFLPRATTSGEQAAMYIRQLIFEGHLRSGERVHQDEIATALGLSRIPVREALVALEQQGWVTIEPNRGAFVTALDEQTVRDHYELLALVYGFAVSKAIERDDGHLGEQLVRLAANFASATTPEDARLFMLAFHVTLIQGADAPRVAVIVRALAAIVPGELFETIPDGYPVAVEGITRVARAIADHDAERAREAFSELLRRLADKVVPVFRERGLVL